MANETSASTFRLRKHADYQRVYKTGRKKHAKTMGYFYVARAAEPPRSAGKFTDPVHQGPRVGLTVPKALGKAVTRNRIKRRMRAALRPSLRWLTGPVDVILHPRKGAADCAFATLQQEIAIIFRSVQASVSREPAGGGREADPQAALTSHPRRAAGAQAVKP